MKLRLFLHCSGKNVDLKIAIKYTFKMVVVTWFIFMLVLIVLDRIVNLIFL